MKTKHTKAEKTSQMILALLIGTLVWGVAIDDEVFSMIVKVPLHLEAANGYVVLENPIDSVRVKLNGSGLEMLNHQLTTQLARISRNIQVSQVHTFPADLSLELEAADIYPLSSLTVSQLIPSRIPFTIDTLVSRKLPISITSSTKLPARFVFVSAEPSYVTVTGPSSIVLLMDSLATEAVNIDSEYTTASLAFCNDLVAYSEQLVQIRIQEPVVPVAGGD